MNISLRTRALSVLAAVAVLAAACGSDSPASETADAVPSLSPTATAEPADTGGDVVETADGPADAPVDEPEAEPTGTVEPTPPPTAPNALFTVFTSGGFVPVDMALRAFPELVVMADGRVYRPGAQITVFPPPLTPAIEQLQLDDGSLAEIVRLVSSDDLPEADTDFGSPNITDVATTLVSWHHTDEVVASVYALGFDDGLTATQIESRTKVGNLISAVHSIVDEASTTAQSTLPPALALLTFPSLGFEEDAVIREWPIDSVPTPRGGGADCVIVSGDELITLWDAAAGATTQTPWRIGDETKVVIFRPVFPYETLC